MAQHKSAAKRARQAVRKNAVNTARKSTVRTSEKSLLGELKKAGKAEAEKVQKLLSQYTSQMMKAAQKGVFTKKTAARKIARLSAAAHKLATK